MTTFIIYLFYFIGLILSWIIIYYVVKAAVKNAIKESRVDNAATTSIQERKPELFANPEQMRLQQRYDKGEITFEFYQSEWEKFKK